LKVEPVASELGRHTAGLLATKVAELARYVVVQRPGAPLTSKAVRWWPEQVVPVVEGFRWLVGAARARVVVAGEPPVIVGLFDPRQVGLEAGRWICVRSRPG